MGKISTAAALLALVMTQTSLVAQDRVVGGAPVAQSAGEAPDASATPGADQAGSPAHDGSHHRINPRDPRVIAAALAALAILTLGIIIATENHKHHHPTSP